MAVQCHGGECNLYVEVPGRTSPFLTPAPPSPGNRRVMWRFWQMM